MTNQTRSAAVAGQFYPAEPAVLQADVNQLLAQVYRDQPLSQVTRDQKALIAPHAGYVYSGPTAAQAYARLKNQADSIKRVILLGPSHRVAFKGIAACTSTTYETPLGEIKVDAASINQLLDLPFCAFFDEAHTEEHSLEVQLPFLQTVLNHFEIVPLVVGNATPIEVAQVLQRLWGGPETLIVVSSDLSHYHAYQEAQVLDQSTSQQILNYQNDLTGEQACGCQPINGLLQVARQKGLHIETIEVCNSGDTAGDHNRVVGYGAYSLVEQKEMTDPLPLSLKQQLLQVARMAIFHPLHHQGNYTMQLDQFPPRLGVSGASFVTLKINGQLRGCIGSLQAHRPLLQDVAQNAHGAAFKDPRFPALTSKEYQDIEIHISILNPPVAMPVSSKESLIAALRPGIDGLILSENGLSATFLPSVWEQLPDPKHFVAQLRRKAGLDPEHWGDFKAQNYITTEFY